jgi:hypothetical protein
LENMVSTHGRRFFLVLLLSVRLVASVSLSQFQEIGGFSDMCLNVWVQHIQGCTYGDFINGNSCSSVCLAGMQDIQAEVLMACAGAFVSSNTLLGAFLQGEGVAILCPNHNAQGNPQTSTTQVATTTTTTSTSATQQDSQTAQDTATTMTTTTTTTAATQQIASTTTSTQTIPSTTTSPSGTSATTLAISIGAGTQPSSTTSTSSVTTTTANPEAKGFGGVGDAFNILGNDGNSRIGQLSLEGISVTMSLAVLIAATIW